MDEVVVPTNPAEKNAVVWSRSECVKWELSLVYNGCNQVILPNLSLVWPKIVLFFVLKWSWGYYEYYLSIRWF